MVIIHLLISQAIFEESLRLHVLNVKLQGVVHRDIKPGNFLFSRKLNKGFLIDFNLAMVRMLISLVLCLCIIFFSFILYDNILMEILSCPCFSVLCTGFTAEVCCWK